LPYFEYKGKDRQGVTREGQVNEGSRDKLLDWLRREGITPLEIRELGNDPPPRKKTPHDKAPGGRKPSGGGSRSGISDTDKAFFTRQFSTMLRAGFTLDRVIDILYKQAKKEKLREILYQMGEDLQKGSSFHDAMARHKELFDEMYLSMVSVGEASGNLPEIFSRLAEIIEKNLTVMKKLRAASAYPVFILTFSSILCYVLLAVFLPNFIPVFEGVGMDIDKQYPLTAFLIKLSDLITHPFGVMMLVGGVLAVIVLLRFTLMTREGRRVFDGLVLRIPYYSNLVRQSAMSRFCRSFSYLTSSGVPVLNSLNMLSRISSNVFINEAIGRVANRVREGESISRTMEKEPLFPDLVVQMITVGEDSGAIPEMMEKASSYLDEELENTISMLTSIMEPAMMIMVGVIVGVFVMGILVPILSLATQVNK
jgi:type IV pilus assembly protein PilC